MFVLGAVPGTNTNVYGGKEFFVVSRNFASGLLPVEKFFLISALMFALAGAAVDVHSRRIPNWLTYTGLVSALIFRSFLLGWAGMTSGFIGALAAGGVFYPFFLLGGMGGGDVKLVAAVGAWAGHPNILVILIAAAIAGGLIALGYMVLGKQVRRTLLNTAGVVRYHFTSRLQPHPAVNIHEQTSIRVPFGVAIAIGTLYGVGSALWWR